MNFNDQVKAAIDTLIESQTKHLNRQMALEAMMEALLDRVDPPALPGIAEEYEGALIRLAEGLPPDMQRPELWTQWSTFLEAMRQHKLPPPKKS